MTKLMTISGPVYTKLPVHEVRMYMQGGIKTNVFEGFEDEAGTIPILIHADAVEWIYL